VCGCRCYVDQVKQATVKSSQDWGPVVYNKPPSSSATAMLIDGVSVTPVQNVRDLDIHIHSDLSTRTHFQRTTSSCFAALRQLLQIRRLVPTATFQTLTAGLREQHAGWHSSLPHAQTSVSSGRCGTAHLPSRALRSRHWCTRQSTLVACTGANPIQDSGADIQSPPWWQTTVGLPGAVHLYCWRPWSTALRSAGTNRLVVPPVRLTTVSSRAFPIVAAKIWNSLPEHIVSAPKLQSFRRHSKKFLLQQSFCLRHFSGLCSGFGYLGHSKKSLIDWMIPPIPLSV